MNAEDAESEEIIKVFRSPHTIRMIVKASDAETCKSFLEMTGVIHRLSILLCAVQQCNVSKQCVFAQRFFVCSLCQYHFRWTCVRLFVWCLRTNCTGYFRKQQGDRIKEMLEAIATLQAELDGSELVEVVLSEPESSDEGLF
jgi:hypothetical protein